VPGRSGLSRGLLAACALAAAVLAVAAGPARAGGYVVTAVWGDAGSARGQLALPKGAAVDAAGFVYVVDYVNHTLIRYAPSGVVERVWGGYGGAPGKFDAPTRVAIGPDGSVYVADAGNQRIQRFTPDGRLLSCWGREGAGPGEFRHPRGISVAGDGSVYVTDEGNARVQVFTANGRFLRSWGRPGVGRGCFRFPKDIAVGPGGRVYVVETRGCRVQVFTRGGRWLAAWGRRGAAPGRFSAPRGLTVDGRGHVFVADTVNCRVQEFLADGSFVRQWGAQGKLPGLFAAPRDVACAPDGSLVVVDTYNRRLQRFALSGLEDDGPPDTLDDAHSGWFRAPVTATLQAGDAGSGVAVTYARVRPRTGPRRDFGPYSAPLWLGSQGGWVLEYLSVDVAGNQEAARRRTLWLDWTPPSVGTLPSLHAQSGSPVTLRCTIGDSLSPSCRVAVRVLRDGALLRVVRFDPRPVSAAGREQVLRFGSWLGRGVYRVELAAWDLAGNRAARAARLTVR